MAVLFTPPYQQFFDSNGDPLAGGKIYTYAAGTTTPKATYTAADGLTSLANPIVLDSAGRAVIFIDGSYRFDIYDSASNLIRSVDNVTNFSAIAAAASYGSSLIANYSTGSPQFFAGDATVASASTVDLWAAGAPRVTITGTTTITSLGTPPSSSDVEILVTFSGALTLTYNASTLWLPGAANIVTAAGDRAKFRPRGSTGWECVSYQRVSKENARKDIGATALPQEFRLTLTSATPVTTGDVTSATTIYCTPYTGNSIALYDGTNWNIRQSAEFSLALGTLTSGKPYDVFCYDNAGTPTLEFLVWTNDTTRATALVYQNGVLVKSGATTRRYLGTFYTTSTTMTEDSVAKRYLWNYYNRVNRSLFVTDATATWTYTTATIRQARASAANQVEFVVGVNEDVINASLQVTFANSSANVLVIAGFGLDSTTALAADQLRAAHRTQVANVLVSGVATYCGFPGVGRHYLAWLEYSAATGTTTWTGSNDGSSQTGIRGTIRG